MQFRPSKTVHVNTLLRHFTNQPSAEFDCHFRTIIATNPLKERSLFQKFDDVSSTTSLPATLEAAIIVVILLTSSIQPHFHCYMMKNRSICMNLFSSVTKHVFKQFKHKKRRQDLSFSCGNCEKSRLSFDRFVLVPPF